MKDHLRQFVTGVPAGKDYLGHMSDAQRTAWSHDLGYSINETLEALAEARVPITVDVKLVGFAGDGNEALHIADHELQMFLRTLHKQLETVALHPSPAHMTLKPEIVFRVQPAYYELSGKVAAAINQAINTGQPSSTYTSYPLHLVPYGEVDKLLQEDFGHGDGSYTIYLLNPPAHAPYAYSYQPPGSNQHESCPGSLWVSDKRYAWFDLTANLTFYGPGPGGKGQVFTHSTPILKHYKAQDVHRAITPDLAALVWSACQHLVWPPLHHGKLSYNPKLEVHLVYMVEALQRPAPGNGRVDVAALQQQLQAVGQPLGQQVTVLEHFVMFSTCDHCVAAYSGALKARTSRAAGAKGSFKLVVSHYLDLPDLERWLAEWREALLSEAGVNWDTEHGGAAILPVFIFDVPSSEPVLLDGLLQAAVLGQEPVLLDGLLQAAVLGQGDVVAVRSAAQPLQTFFGCFDLQMAINPQKIHRPVLAAVMQQAYGIADPALAWSQATGKMWSFIWSVGQNPFGSLGSTASLSFAQKDAALRNMALAYLNSSMHHAAALMRGFEMLAPAGSNGRTHYVKGYLQPEQVLPYNQRISLLLFKVQEAAAALAEGQHALAVGYAVSTTEDVAALHKITRHYKVSLRPDLVCMGKPDAVRWWLLPSFCCFITLALVVWRCARGPSDDDSDSKPGSRRGSSFGGGHHRAY
ncbi:hypothetical protein OEZ85_011230 [Tetradesmus obliquus]|uniref:DUF7906 domain-containing protein n=1 Tax=Tetradesmus obliquus TaxID=3088 RepID=A0ABY8TPN5_TETOB|nr:hypothetical protein OEZ85_011230 [Tetradesmus obliquus]